MAAAPNAPIRYTVVGSPASPERSAPFATPVDGLPSPQPLVHESGTLAPTGPRRQASPPGVLDSYARRHPACERGTAAKSHVAAASRGRASTHSHSPVPLGSGDVEFGTPTRGGRAQPFRASVPETPNSRASPLAHPAFSETASASSLSRVLRALDEHTNPANPANPPGGPRPARPPVTPWSPESFRKILDGLAGNEGPGATAADVRAAAQRLEALRTDARRLGRAAFTTAATWAQDRNDALGCHLGAALREDITEESQLLGGFEDDAARQSRTLHQYLADLRTAAEAVAADCGATKQRVDQWEKAGQADVSAAREEAARTLCPKVQEFAGEWHRIATEVTESAHTLLTSMGEEGSTGTLHSRLAQLVRDVMQCTRSVVQHFPLRDAHELPAAFAVPCDMLTGCTEAGKETLRLLADTFGDPEGVVGGRTPPANPAVLREQEAALLAQLEDAQTPWEKDLVRRTWSGMTDAEVADRAVQDVGRNARAVALRKALAAVRAAQRSVAEIEHLRGAASAFRVSFQSLQQRIADSAKWCAKLRSAWDKSQFRWAVRSEALRVAADKRRAAADAVYHSRVKVLARTFQQQVAVVFAGLHAGFKQYLEASVARGDGLTALATAAGAVEVAMRARGGVRENNPRNAVTTAASFREANHAYAEAVLISLQVNVVRGAGTVLGLPVPRV